MHFEFISNFICAGDEFLEFTDLLQVSMLRSRDELLFEINQFSWNQLLFMKFPWIYKQSRMYRNTFLNFSSAQ